MQAHSPNWTLSKKSNIFNVIKLTLNAYVYLKYNTLNKHFPESIFLSDIYTNKTGQNFYMLPQQGMLWCSVEHRQLLKKKKRKENGHH